MKKPNRKFKSKAKLRLPAFLLFSILIYLIYYQLWHRSEQINGKIYVLNKSLNAHLSDIWTVKFSPDGNLIASGSVDSTVNWNLIYTLEVPEHNQAADFSPDNKLLTTGGRDKSALGEFLQNIFGDSEYNRGISMRLWDTKTGRLLQTFSNHSNDVNDISFSSDGKWIVSASSDKTVKVWQFTNPEIKGP